MLGHDWYCFLMQRKRSYNFEYLQVRTILQCDQSKVTIVRSLYPFPKMIPFVWRTLRKLLRRRRWRYAWEVSNVKMCQIRGSSSRPSLFESFLEISDGQLRDRLDRRAVVGGFDRGTVEHRKQKPPLALVRDQVRVLYVPFMETCTTKCTSL